MTPAIAFRNMLENKQDAAMEEVLGKYRDLNSDKVYTVLKRSEEIVEAPITNTSEVVDTISNYVTACGRHVEPKDDDLSAFTFDDFEGEIHRIDNS